jgi:hypothetical protein
MKAFFTHKVYATGKDILACGQIYDKQQVENWRKATENRKKRKAFWDAFKKTHPGATATKEISG